MNHEMFNQASMEDFYALMTKKSAQENIDDPILGVIENILMRIPFDAYGSFFHFFATRKKYFNREGFSTPAFLNAAANDFIFAQQQELTKKIERNTSQKNILFEKIKYAFDFIQKAYIKKDIPVKDILPRMKTKQTGEHLFSIEEITLLNNRVEYLYYIFENRGLNAMKKEVDGVLIRSSQDNDQNVGLLAVS